MNRLSFLNKLGRVRFFGASAIWAALASSDVVHGVLTKLPVDRAANYNRFGGSVADNLAVIVAVSMDVC
jgi:hypothetical protein